MAYVFVPLPFHADKGPSLKVYKGTGDWVRNAKFSEAELTRYIIGTFSGYERPMSPSGMAGRSFDAWISGRTYEDVVKEREEMLTITEEQFHSYADYFDKICAQGYLCAVGSEKTLHDRGFTRPVCKAADGEALAVIRRMEGKELKITVSCGKTQGTVLCV